MKKPWTHCLSALAVVFCLLAPSAFAQRPDYTTISQPQATDDPARIEVIEFFSFACPHCHELNPLIHEWAGKLPKDVYFKRVPVDFGAFYLLMAKLFYTLEATGDLARLDTPLFDALHVRRLRLATEKSVADWAVSQGVDARAFSEAWNSFGVDSKLKRAEQTARAYRIQGVPALAVDGRYLIGGKSFQEMLASADWLIERRRAERKPKK